MKLTKKLEAEILKLYCAYWKAYLEGDMNTFASFLDENIIIYGTAASEIFASRKDAVEFYKATADQMTGKTDFRERQISLKSVGGTFVINEQSDLYVLIDGVWTFYGHARITAIFEQKGNTWKLVHQHGSFPDSRTEEGEQINTEKIKAENIQLKDAVKRRTIELEEKNRDLEIESSLERVRTVAMGMRKPDDMLEVCRIISQQSESLGIKEIRNVQTAIIYEEKGTYLNYEYYAKHDKLIITEVDFKNHELQSLFANRMLQGVEELFSESLTGKEVKDWYNYQKTTNQFADSYLENTQSLNYYFYSLGPVALGISAYAPLSEEEISLFKRFRNVFDLAYRRFLDIEQAEAQAREAKIEASLERVRAQALSMRKPDDLPAICEVLFTELTTLGFSEIRNAMINIHDDEKASFVNYDYSDEIGQSINHLEYNIHPLIEKQVKQVRSAADAFSVTSFAKEDLKDWIAFRKKIGEKDDPRIENTDALYYYFYSIGTGSIGISTFSSITEEKLGVLKRFRNVFDFAYRRYTDVAQAETQAREAQVELGLERVRARAMAMQKSEELAELVDTVFKELTKLHFLLDRCIIMLYDPKTHGSTWWMADPEPGSVPVGLFIKYHEHKPYLEYIKAWQARTLKWEYLLEGISKKEWDNYIFSETDLSQLPEFVKAGMMSVDRVFLNASFNNFGSITASTVEALPAEQFDILLRFAKVFDMTYTRFNDLKQAEAQAREAQIELALERVRARTMAMQHSDELAEASFLLDSQVRALGIKTRGCAFNIYSENDSTEWFSSEMGTMPQYKTPRENIFLRYYKEGQTGQLMYIQSYEGDACRAHYDYLCTLPVMGDSLKKLKESGGSFPTQQIDHVTYFKYGYLLFITLEHVPDAHDIFLRFTKVFEQTYTRFLDLQKAEAQARDAKIEAALERIRSRALAMHNSSEVGDVSDLLFSELEKMDINPTGFSIMVFDREQDKYELWRAKEVAHQGVYETFSIRAMYNKLDQYLPGFTEELESRWNSGAPYFIAKLSGRKRISFLEANRDMGNYTKEQFENVLRIYPDPVFWQLIFFKYGWLGLIQNEQLPEDDLQVIRRFADVFEFAHTRFLDLQKSESQAREAKIEAALERVRSKTMAMHNSQDVGNTAAAMFDELVKLGVETLRCGILIIDATKHMEVWTASSDPTGKASLLIGRLDMMIHPLLQGAHSAWKNKELTFTYELEGKDLVEYYQAITTSSDYPFKIKIESLPAKQINTEFFFPEGALFAFTREPISADVIQVFKRFAGVFGLTYRRFLDLQKAEANARESQIEAGLERVRSRTLAMQKSDELAETAAVVFRQLIGLGIAPNRLYIAIIKDKSGSIEFWITDEDGNKVSTQFTGNSNRNRSIQKMYEGWVVQKKSITIEMHGEELADYIHYLGDELKVPFKQGISQKRRIQTIAYFSKGFIGLASPDEQPFETTRLLERFAGVFNLTFTRFNDLKLAEAQAQQAYLDLIQLQTEKKRAEEALAELKATQTQLIQSEKMASLGELTAGIAHEIQNPLNFVNNFSEVSNELIDEMNEELDKGDFDEAKAIANDIKQNLEKINHHGKRADAIVKGMLQHSRSSSGVKEPTDINALADEYLRLAYHGLRAKDKSFNGTLKTDFDESIGKIDIVPQDIGRVILNLITNAFYACAERSRSTVDEKNKTGTPEGFKTLQGFESYEPTVSVSTESVIPPPGGTRGVLISVKDNGPGIPPKVLDKIFQPFFTTKPTGEGTGLGLSMSYDIVKAHGGELKVMTKEGEGTNFIIVLP